MTDKSGNKKDTEDESIERSDKKDSPVEKPDDKENDEQQSEIKELRQRINKSKNELESREKEIDELKDQRKKLKKGISKRNKIIEQHKEKAERNKKNTEREMIEKFATDMGQIRQSVMLALENTEDGCNVRSGLNATVEKMDNILSEHDITILEPEKGNKFNADLHEVIETEESKELEEGLVLETYKQGFAHDGTIIEPAKVIISE